VKFDGLDGLRFLHVENALSDTVCFAYRATQMVSGTLSAVWRLEDVGRAHTKELATAWTKKTR